MRKGGIVSTPKRIARYVDPQRTYTAANAATSFAWRGAIPVSTSSTRGFLVFGRGLCRGNWQGRGLLHGLENDRRSRRGDRRNRSEALAEESAQSLGVARAPSPGSSPRRRRDAL